MVSAKHRPPRLDKGGEIRRAECFRVLPEPKARKGININPQQKSNSLILPPLKTASNLKFVMLRPCGKSFFDHKRHLFHLLAGWGGYFPNFGFSSAPMLLRRTTGGG